MFVSIGSLLAVALFGWVAGMWTHRRSEHWCPECGTRLACPECRRAGLHSLPSRRDQDAT